MPKKLNNPRETILKEAKSLLKEQGYKMFSMRELAKRCNIGLGTVYNYFINKQSIVSEIFNTTWSKILDELKEVNVIDITFEEKIRRIYGGVEKYLNEHKDIFMELTKEEKRISHHNQSDVLEPLYIITDEIIVKHKERYEIEIKIETRKITIFLISNMVMMVMKESDFNIDDLLLIMKMKVYH